MSEQPSQPASEKKKGGSLVLILIIVIVAAGAAGGGVFWWTRHHATVAAAPAEPKPSERGIVSFEPFVVNLADPNASRFLRATIRVVVPSAEEAEHLEKTPVLLMQARSSILELLTVQTSDALVTPEGKAALKKEIAEKVAKSLGEVKVLDVLFSDFVIQF